MRKLLAIGLTTLLLGACADRQARQHTQALDQLNQAIATFQAAESGYVPQDAIPPGQTMRTYRLADYRQDKLAQAAGQLDPLISDADTPQQIRAAALRLLASVHHSQARQSGRLAMQNWAELSYRSNLLLDRLLAVEHADAAIHLAAYDLDDMLADLRQQRTAEQGRLADRQREQAELTRRIGELNEQVAAYHRQSSGALAEKRKLQTDAFTTQGPERYDIYDQATQADTRAKRATANEQGLVAKRDVFQSELTVVEARIRQSNQLIQSLEQRMAALTQQQEQGQVDRQAAVENKEQAETDLVAQLEQLSEQWAQQVREPMQQAVQQLTQATEMMAQAVGISSAQTRRDAELELLNYQTTRAHTLSMYVVALGDWGHVLNVVARAAMQDRSGQQLMARRMSGFQTDLLEVRNQQQDAVTQARSSINDGLEVASRLAGEGRDDEVTALADQRVNQLRNYNSALEDARL